jgi:hypothetical protein
MNLTSFHCGFIVSNLQGVSRGGLLKQAFSVHAGTPLDVQEHVLQSCFQLVPGVQVSVQKQLTVIIILIPKYATF